MSTELISEYLRRENQLLWENANQSQSYIDMKSYIANDAVKHHTMASYTDDIRRLHEEGHFYIHDRSNGIVPYCHGGNLRLMLGEGIWTTHIVGGPAKHFSTALNQIVNYLCSMQNEWSGAQAFADFNTLTAPLVWKDKLNYSAVKQNVQEMVFSLGFPARSGETPFTNLMFNFKTPDFLADKHVVTPGLREHVYGDFEDEAKMILRAFNEVIGEGDHHGNPFTFPIPTLNLIPGMDWGSPLMDEIFRTEARYGVWYFMNYIGSGIKQNSKRAMCCRFAPDLTVLADAGGRWALEGSTGSIGVVSLNMGKLGYTCRDDNHVYERLRWLMDKALESLLIKSGWVKDMNSRGMLPMTKYYGINFDRYFRTIAMIGFNEFFLNYNGKSIVENVGMARDIMNYMREWTREKQQEHGVFINVEQAPGESSATTLAEIDLVLHPGIKTQGTPEHPYYSTLLVPSNMEMNINKRIAVEQEILPLYSGGTVHRIFMGEAMPSPQGLKKLVQRIVTHSKIPYLDMAATMSVCTKGHGRFPGTQPDCPRCGAPVRTYQRITGYYRPIEKANHGKVQEFKERVYVNL